MILWQYLLPKHLLSIWMHKLSQVRLLWFKNLLIKLFIKFYKVNLTEAEFENIIDYEHFNAFFTRALKTNARPIDNAKIISPVDGLVFAAGVVYPNGIFNIKSQLYNIKQLLDKTTNASYFYNGHYIGIYLAPKNYHRVHMPLTARLLNMAYIPGGLFSVNQKNMANIPALLSRNERLICYFSADFGKFAMVLVGAIFVGSIQTIWHGKITPPYGKYEQTWDYTNTNITLNKGDELGRFNMGSTIILLLPKQAKFNVDSINAGTKINMGQAI